VYFLCLYKVKKTIGRLQLEAPRAYKCKQILGLCQVVLERVLWHLDAHGHFPSGPP
jgi:hypothetical protein